MAKKYFELERDYAALKAAYHEAAQDPAATVAGLAAIEADIMKASSAMNSAITAGAKGDNLVGIKRRPGCFEISDGVNRSQGETAEEAAVNWNDGVFWKSPAELETAE